MAPRKIQQSAVRRSSSPVPMACSLAGDSSPSSPDVLHTLYTALLKTRLLEEHVLSLLRTGRIPGTDVAILGGEATELGACIGLQPEDSFSSSQPTLASTVVRGLPMEQVFTELLHHDNKDSMSSSNRIAEPFRVLPQASSLTGQLDIAAGVALSYRNFGKANVVVTLADNGLAALGFWHEAASLASRHRLPLVFMVENSEYSHTNGFGMVHSDQDLRDRAEAYGFPGITVDGNDIVAVWRVTQESIHRARTGSGPTLIECRTWRWHAETSSSNGNKRPIASNGWQKDPLLQMEHYMKKRSLWKQSWKERLVTDYREALRSAFDSASSVAQKR